MSRLGPSLRQIQEISHNHQIPLKTVVFLAPQLLARLRHVHSKGLVFRDVKPDQFCVGSESISNDITCYVVDFGLATYLHDPTTGRHIQNIRQRYGAKTGTARYASLGVHNGNEHGRRDDLESLGYVLVDLALGTLPWVGVTALTSTQGWNKIREMKRDILPNELCQELPDEFANLLEYSRGLRFKDVPNYEQWIKIFKSLYHRLWGDDMRISWSD